MGDHIAADRRRLGAAVTWLAVGTLVAALAQVLLPSGTPLYDGVVLTDPYRYLNPTNAQPANPTSYGADLPVTNGKSPQITAATGENPPQAQLIALEGVFTVPAGDATLHIAITPVAPAAPISSGTISGNVYRIAVTDPSGNPVALAAGQRPTLAMRSAVPLADGVIYRLDNGSWTRLDTVSNAALSIYTAEPDALGDFAVVETTGGGISTTTIVIAATVGVVVLAILLWAIRLWLRRRNPLPPARGRPTRPNSTRRRR